MTVTVDLELNVADDIMNSNLTTAGVITTAISGYREIGRTLREDCGDEGPNTYDLKVIVLRRFFCDDEYLYDRVHLGRRLREAERMLI